MNKEPEWLQRFKGTQASFSGVPFRIEEIDMIFGRDLTLQDNKTGGLAAAFGQVSASEDSIQDQGKLPRQLDILCSFYGDNYIEDRDNFIGAIEFGGIASLILPNHDPLSVRAGRAVNRFSNREGGTEKILVTFVQSSETVQPVFVLDTAGAAIDAIDDRSFIERFSSNLSSGATWVADASTTLTQKFSTDLLDTLGLGAAGDALDVVTAAAFTISQNATTLIYTPTTLANSISDTTEALTNAFQQPINAFNAQKQLFDSYGSGQATISAGSSTAQDAIDNQDAFNQLVKNSALAEMGRAAVLAEYATLEDALRVKAQIEEAARLQQLANGSIEGQEQSYYEIANIVAAVSKHITEQGDLPTTLDLTFNEENVALVLAQDLYGNASRGDELVERNAARHPLFLPRELEVLSF
jgi:prophage DNA circulation protein